MGVLYPPDSDQQARSASRRRRRAAAEKSWLAGRPERRAEGAGVLEQRERRIRELAYLKAQGRGFSPGQEDQDWLDAEQEVDRASRSLPRS